ncbi:Ribosomal protein S5 domain 2-type fold [Phytophthora cactorum]|nr:Ribosomal protein S5 domain 2-type fold [Phytophthora cactorum]
MPYQAKPIVRVAVEPEDPRNFGALEAGLQRLYRSDPTVEVHVQETGEHVIDLKDRFAKVAVQVSEPLVGFRESIVDGTISSFQENIVFKDLLNPDSTKDEASDKDKINPDTQDPKVALGTTPDGSLTLKLRALPLPLETAKLLEENAPLLKRIALSKKSNDETDTKETDAEVEAAAEDVSAFKKKLEKALQTSENSFLKSLPLDQIWSCGPRRVGPNILINSIPGYHSTGCFFPSNSAAEVRDSEKAEQIRKLENSIVTGFQMASSAGPLCDEPVWGVAFIIEDVIFHEKKSEEEEEEASKYGPLSGQVISSMRTTCLMSFVKQPVRLVEAVYECTVQCQAEQLGKLYSVISKRRGDIYSEELSDGTALFTVKAHLPVVESFGFATDLLIQTSGAASNPQLIFSHWKEEREDYGERVYEHNYVRRYIEAVRLYEQQPLGLYFSLDMSPVRVTPTRGESRALVALSKWASRHAEKHSLSWKKSITPAALIEKTHARQLAAREKVFERHLPFSWLRFFIGAVSLALVFSDVLRSGVGVSNLQEVYPSLQPDEVVSFDTSWNYSVFASTKDEASSGSTTARVWSYKYDSTSITWRAFASFLSAPDFPGCFFYTNQCPGQTFAGDVAFKMIDSLVNVISRINSDFGPRSGPVGLTLRSESEYIDRLHQFILPKWFININWRTNQALHFSPELLATTNARTICFPIMGKRIRTPRFCHELWTNFDRSCAPTDVQGRSAGLLYVHTMARLRDVQDRFPNATMDLTFLESQEDMQVCRGGLTSLGFKRSDVSAIVRARNCVGSGATRSCETIFVEDYRYETGLLISDVVQWYKVVAALRIIGQGYFLLLPKKMSTWTNTQGPTSFMKVPTQCVVFGSPFPVSCYVLAHLLDAPFTYDVLESHFFSQVVQMRNVWIYALLWHMVVTLSVKQRIIGVPEFLLSAFSSITLIAQYRSTSFRSSKILRMTELPNNLSRAWVATKYQYSFAHRGSGSVLLGGVIIDLKFLVCFVFVIAGAWAVRALWLNYLAAQNGEESSNSSTLLSWGPVADGEYLRSLDE